MAPRPNGDVDERGSDDQTRDERGPLPTRLRHLHKVAPSSLPDRNAVSSPQPTPQFDKRLALSLPRRQLASGSLSTARTPRCNSIVRSVSSAFWKPEDAEAPRAALKGNGLTRSRAR